MPREKLRNTVVKTAAQHTAGCAIAVRGLRSRTDIYFIQAETVNYFWAFFAGARV